MFVPSGQNFRIHSSFLMSSPKFGTKPIWEVMPRDQPDRQPDRTFAGGKETPLACCNPEGSVLDKASPVTMQTTCMPP